MEWLEITPSHPMATSSFKKLPARLLRIFKRRKSFPLPQELYGSIFNFIDTPQVLLKLCYVSKAFRHEAQRVLYQSVCFVADHSRTEAWTRQVTSNPRLAASVRCLTIVIDYPVMSSELKSPGIDNWFDVLGSAMRSLNSLTE